MKTYSIGQFAKEIGVTIQTLRDWDKTDKAKRRIEELSKDDSYEQN